MWPARLAMLQAGGRKRHWGDGGGGACTATCRASAGQSLPATWFSRVSGDAVNRTPGLPAWHTPHWKAPSQSMRSVGYRVYTDVGLAAVACGRGACAPCPSHCSPHACPWSLKVPMCRSWCTGFPQFPVLLAQSEVHRVKGLPLLLPGSRIISLWHPHAMVLAHALVVHEEAPAVIQ